MTENSVYLQPNRKAERIYICSRQRAEAPARNDSNKGAVTYYQNKDYGNKDKMLQQDRERRIQQRERNGERTDVREMYD